MRFEVMDIKMFNTTENRTFSIVQNLILLKRRSRGTCMDAGKVPVRAWPAILLISAESGAFLLINIARRGAGERRQTEKTSRKKRDHPRFLFIVLE
jgi:hypothetical protein